MFCDVEEPESFLQKYLARLEAGALLESVLAEVPAEEAELLRTAAALRDIPAPARAAEASRLVTWLRIFRDSRKAQAVPQAEEKLRVKVRKELDLGPAPVATWLLALELATSREALDAVLADLEKSWIRGEWSASTEDVALLTGALAPLDPPAATRWFARIDEPRTYAEARGRASLLAATKQNDAARGRSGLANCAMPPAGVVHRASA